jgi:hypothetical protein
MTPLRCYLAAIAIFCNEVKGKSALAIHLGKVRKISRWKG